MTDREKDAIERAEDPEAGMDQHIEDEQIRKAEGDEGDEEDPEAGMDQHIEDEQIRKAEEEEEDKMIEQQIEDEQIRKAEEDGME